MNFSLRISFDCVNMLRAKWQDAVHDTFSKFLIVTRHNGRGRRLDRCGRIPPPALARERSPASVTRSEGSSVCFYTRVRIVVSRAHGAHRRFSSVPWLVPPRGGAVGRCGAALRRSGRRSQYWLQRARNPPWYVESWDSRPSGCDGQSGAVDSWLKSGWEAPWDSDSGGCWDRGSWERRGGRRRGPRWVVSGGRCRPRWAEKAACGTGACSMAARSGPT